MQGIFFITIYLLLKRTKAIRLFFAVLVIIIFEKI